MGVDVFVCPRDPATGDGNLARQAGQRSGSAAGVVSSSEMQSGCVPWRIQQRNGSEVRMRLSLSSCGVHQSDGAHHGSCRVARTPGSRGGSTARRICADDRPRNVRAETTVRRLVLHGEIDARILGGGRLAFTRALGAGVRAVQIDAIVHLLPPPTVPLCRCRTSAIG